MKNMTKYELKLITAPEIIKGIREREVIKYSPNVHRSINLGNTARLLSQQSRVGEGTPPPPSTELNALPPLYS